MILIEIKKFLFYWYHYSVIHKKGRALINCSNYEFQFMKAVSHFPHDTLKALIFYEIIYNEIPMSEKLNVLLRIIYSEFEIDSSIIDWIYKCLTDEATEN